MVASITYYFSLKLTESKQHPYIEVILWGKDATRNEFSTARHSKSDKPRATWLWFATKSEDASICKTSYTISLCRGFQSPIGSLFKKELLWRKPQIKAIVEDLIYSKGARKSCWKSEKYWPPGFTYPERWAGK